MELALRPHGAALEEFAESVGDSSAGAVAVRGGATQWELGGLPQAGVRFLSAPCGIRELEPAELVVRCGAATTVAELEAALAAFRLMCPIDALRADEATVGGVLSVGHSGHRRLRYGHIRDLLLEARFVDADGRLVKAGAPVVKNVTGFDLCRLLVGSLGTLGLLGEVVLRCRPKPTTAVWLCAEGADPFDVRKRLYAPSSILWNGETTWILLEGDRVEIDAERRSLVGSWAECAQPMLPTGRASMRPGTLRTLVVDGVWMAEIGVGTVHGLERNVAMPPANAALFEDIKRAYDPTGRLNPGRRPW